MAHFVITLRPYKRSDGQSQIIVRYTYNGHHFTQPIKNMLGSKTNFDFDLQQFKNTVKNEDAVTLKTFQTKINDVKAKGNDILLNYGNPEPKLFFQKLFEVDQITTANKMKCLVQLYGYWINNINGSKVYKSTYGQLVNFKEARGGHLLVDEYGKTLLQEFERYLANAKKTDGDKEEYFKQSYIKKCTKHFKYLGTYLTDLRLPIDQNFRDFKSGIKGAPRAKPIALTKEEFDQLFYLDLSDNFQLNLIKSAFIIGTASGGIRVSDLYALSAENFDLENFTISFTQRKTNGEVFNPLAEAYIKPHLNFFLENLHHLPTEQEFNLRLKAIGNILKWDRTELIHEYRGAAKHPAIFKIAIKDLVSTRFMRKSFISMLVELGYSKEVIKSFTGHEDEQIINDYIQLHQHTKRTAIEGFAPSQSN